MSPSEPRKRGMTTCKTCDEKVSGTQRFWCFSCGVVLHITPECTGFSASVVESFQEVTKNLLLLCNLCAQNERETLIQDVYATRMNHLEENNHKLQAVQDKLDEYKMNVSDTYASVVALKKETKNIASKLEQPVQVKTFESKVAEPRGLRLRGIPEMSGILPDKTFMKDMEKVESAIEFLAGKKCNVKSLKRVGQFKGLSPKPRTLIVQVENEACRTLLLKASRELKIYREMSGPVFLSKELTIEELKTENESLRMRKVKIDQGVPRQKLRIRNLKLEMQNDQGIWEEVYDNVADSAKAPSA